MAIVDYKNKQITLKFVYCGPKNAGVSSTLASIYRETTGEELDLQRINDFYKPISGFLSLLAAANKKKYTPETKLEYFALDFGKIQGFQISTMIYGYTLPDGEKEFRARTEGVDCVVFVADSATSSLSQNREALKSVRTSLESPDLLRAVQLNKRDVPDAVSCDELKKYLSISDDVHLSETVAINSKGTTDCFREVAKRTLNCLT